MVFLRARRSGLQLNASQGGSPVQALGLPDHVRAGDYCVAYVVAGTTTAVVTGPAWMTQIGSIVNSTACQLKIFGGFLPAVNDGTFTWTIDDNTTRPWIVQATFWGGVNTNNPYSFPTLINSSGTTREFTTAIQAIQASDDFNTLGVGTGLNAFVADVGGAWATSGATTDFVGSDPASGYPKGAVRSTNSQTAPRFAVLPNVGTMSECSVRCTTFQITQLPSATGVIRSGVFARYVDANNYVAAYNEVNSYSYSAGPPYNKISQDIKKVVEVVVAGVSTRYDISSYALPDIWFYSEFAINKSHTLSITREGRIKYSTANEASIEIEDFMAVLGPAGAMAAGKVGLYDSNSSGTAYARCYTSFQATGSANNNPVVQVVGAMVPNGDTFQITATPNDPVALDEHVGDAASNIGRALGTRYFALPALSDTTITVTDNLEAGAAAMDVLTIGSIVLNPSDDVEYGNTKRAVGSRVAGNDVGWRFYLANSESFEHICELPKATDRSLSWVLNGPGSANFKLNMLDEAASKIDLLRTCLIAYRGGKARWSGPIWTIQEESDGDAMTVSAVGWLQLLERRLLSPAHERYARFGTTDAGIIAAHLLALTNEQWHLPFWVGHVQGTQQRRRTYERYQAIGPEIQALSELESGYDIWIDPATRELQLWNRFEEDRSDQVAFGYKTATLHNLASITREAAADKVVNGIYVTTKTPGTTPPQQQDTSSIATYGLQEEQASLGEVTDPNVALAYAAGELVYRSTPLQMYTITPRPGGPKPLEGYHVGTVVKFSANHGTIQVTDQKARVFSLSLTIDNNGIERVSELGTTVA